MAFAVSAQGPLTPQQRELADYIKSHYTKHEVMIPMRDGVRLLANWSAALPYAQEDSFRPIDRRGCAIQRLGRREQYANIEDPGTAPNTLNHPKSLMP